MVSVEIEVYLNQNSVSLFGTLWHSYCLYHWHFAVSKLCLDSLLYTWISLFLSVCRGIWQSTLWLWTSTTCSNSMPACSMSGASSLPQASSALWVHFLQVLLPAADAFCSRSASTQLKIFVLILTPNHARQRQLVFPTFYFILTSF